MYPLSEAFRSVHPTPSLPPCWCYWSLLPRRRQSQQSVGGCKSDWTVVGCCGAFFAVAAASVLRRSGGGLTNARTKNRWILWGHGRSACCLPDAILIKIWTESANPTRSFVFFFFALFMSKCQITTTLFLLVSGIFIQQRVKSHSRKRETSCHLYDSVARDFNSSQSWYQQLRIIFFARRIVFPSSWDSLLALPPVLGFIRIFHQTARPHAY